MFRFTRTLAILAAIGPLAAAAVVHTRLVKAEPAVDATVATAPATLRLWFSERPEVALSSATILKADNSPVTTVKMAATDDTMSVAGPVPVALEPGRYLVAWRTGSKDGHAIRGKYSFTYQPAASAKP